MSEREWNLTLTVDGEGVIRAAVEDGAGVPVERMDLTPRELGMLLTTLMKSVMAQEGDDVQTVNLN